MKKRENNLRLFHALNYYSHVRTTSTNFFDKTLLHVSFSFKLEACIDNEYFSFEINQNSDYWHGNIAFIIIKLIAESWKYQVMYFIIKNDKNHVPKLFLREWILLLDFLVCTLVAQRWHLSTSHISHKHTHFNKYLHHHFLFCYHTTEFDKRKWCLHSDEKLVVCTILLYPHFPCVKDKDF